MAWAVAGNIRGPQGPAGPSPVVSTITAATTAVSNGVYLASGTFSVTIPVASGTHVWVKNTGTGSITLMPATGSIDSTANFVLPALGSVETFSDDTNVWIF